MTDAREFRNALGRFATGVTIVTTRTPDGEPWGVTVNSFSSVSLEPRLVLWSLAKKSYSLEAFQKTGSFVIHVLAADQEHVSNRFARGAEGKFSGVPCTDASMARLSCQVAQRYSNAETRISMTAAITSSSWARSGTLTHRIGNPCSSTRETTRVPLTLLRSCQS
jgi:Conserved protein/domain typically associated wit h flavoprotein oxygenases, DIM6/NTAB family